MTKEELRDYVDEQRGLGNIPYHIYSTLIDGIDTLEQEPCGKDINVPATDAISRQAVLDGIAIIAKAKAKSDAQKSLMGRVLFFTEHLPSVKPQPKTVLYSGDGYADGHVVYDMAECPNCGYEYEEGDKDWRLPFCPNCGQALNWESEDKE